MAEPAESGQTDAPGREPSAHSADGLIAGRGFTLVLAWAGLGGTERTALTLASHLHDLGARVDVAALTRERGRAREMFEERGIPWREVPFEWPRTRPQKARALASFAWRLRRLRPDVLLPFCARPNVVCGVTWRAAGASLCIWHQHDVNPMTKFGDRLVGLAAKATPVLVSNSLHGADFVAEITGVPRGRIHYVPNAVELPPPVTGRDEWRRTLGAGEGDFVVVMVSNLHHGKDFGTLLDAWPAVEAGLAGDGHRAVLAFAGGGPDEDAAKARSFDRDLRSSVRFLGHVTDVSGLLAACDAGVLSSLREGCPTAVLECMAAGLPVVGTDIAGIREAVGPEGHGYLAPVGDAEALGDALARLARDPQGRRAIGQRNAARVRDEFSSARQIDEYVRTVRSALGVP